MRVKAWFRFSDTALSYIKCGTNSQLIHTIYGMIIESNHTIYRKEDYETLDLATK